MSFDNLTMSGWIFFGLCVLPSVITLLVGFRQNRFVNGQICFVGLELAWLLWLLSPVTS